LHRAQDRQQLLSTQLHRIRANALAWRNGLGAVLAALIGFSLIKGRSDITQLDPRWAVLAGLALVAAFTVGAMAALSLLRAAHGRPWLSKVDELLPGVLGDHQETVAAGRALLRGVVLALVCTVLLVIAVALTWYGPPREGPMLEVRTAEGTFCGTAIRTDAGVLSLRTGAGEVRVDLGEARSLRPVGQCPGTAPS
jgi:hypothetical protein